MAENSDGQQSSDTSGAPNAGQTIATSAGTFEVVEEGMGDSYSSPTFDLHADPQAMATPDPVTTAVPITPLPTTTRVEPVISQQQQPARPPILQHRQFVRPATPETVSEFDEAESQRGSFQTPNTVKVGEEVVEIAPHPTTNRFPWTPVENPTVSVYQVEPTPVVDVPPRQPTEPPQQPAIPTPPEPIQPLPTPAPQPTPPAPVAPIAPPPPPIPEPAPTPVIETKPPEPVEPPQPVTEPIPAPKPAPISFTPAPDSQPPPAQLSPPPVAIIPASQPLGERIYGEHTKKVWNVFRPVRTYQFLVVISLIGMIGSLVAVWYFSGAPTNPFDLPFMQRLINSGK